MQLSLNVKHLTDLFWSDHPGNGYLVSKLHYKFTCALLVAFCVFIGCKQYFGDPIECKSSAEGRSSLIDSWCWSRGTFSVNSAWNKTVGMQVPYSGVDYVRRGDDITYHAYYKWVPVVLLIQAVLFYLPRCFWNSQEGGRLRHLVMDLDCPVLPEDTSVANRKTLVRYFVTHLHKHETYFLSFVFTDLLNFANVVGQMFLMDKFLGKKFLTYGPAVARFQEDRYSDGYSPMVELFPLLTKCRFYWYGRSRDVMRYDHVCLLPINTYNEKIYIFLWFWFVLLSLLSGLAVTYDLVIYLLPRVRLYALKARDTSINKFDLESVLKWLEAGDWLVLDLLCKNMDTVNFQNFVTDLAVTLEQKLLKNRWTETNASREVATPYDSSHLVINEHYPMGPVEGYTPSEL